MNKKCLGRVGSKHWLSKCLIVRGVVINLVDNLHKGDKGKAPNCIKKPTTLWGFLALGGSRERNKYSDNFILHHHSK